MQPPALKLGEKANSIGHDQLRMKSDEAKVD